MRFVWAVASFVIAAVLIGGGIAQRTVFLGPTTEQVAVAEESTTAYVLVDGEVLNRLPGAQTLIAKNDGPVFGAYARTADVSAWLADVDYTHVTLGAENAVESTVVTAAQAAPEVTEATTAGNAALTAAQLPAPQAGTPLGSDLWLDEFTDTGSLIKQLALPDDMSVLLATDGTAPAPTSITLEWPIDNSTPWAGPLVVLGGIALLVGVLFYILGIRHMRRSRGPRRRGTPGGPATGVIDTTETVDAGAESGSRRSGRARRIAITVPALIGSVALMAGCSADAWPKLDGASPSPSPSQTIVAPEDQQAPVATEAQAQRIIERIAAAVAVADTNKDITLAGTRLGGSALAERATNYTLRAKLADEPAPAAIPSGPYRIVLPQAIDGWPRTIMAVWSDESDTTNPPRIMMLTQQDAWSAYKLQYIGQMEASAQIPDLPPADIGANLVRQDSSLLAIAPDELANAYADILVRGEKSAYAPLFDLTTDSFLPKIIADRQARLAQFTEKTGNSTGTLTFTAAAGSSPAIALQTLHSGAIVAVSMEEADVAKSTDPNAYIKLTENKRSWTLAGVEQSLKGFQTTFNDQLFFYVPGQGSNEKISLIGFSSYILKAEELK